MLRAMAMERIWSARTPPAFRIEQVVGMNAVTPITCLDTLNPAQRRAVVHSVGAIRLGITMPQRRRPRTGCFGALLTADGRLLAVSASSCHHP
jgi:hypothetical protein